jgi:hypothetical protein
MRESAALTSHGVHYRLSRRLSDLSTEPGQPHLKGSAGLKFAMSRPDP